MPLDITNMTQKQIDKEIMKGIEDLESGRTVSFEEFEEEFKRKYDIRV